jgi:hypothetical protein
MANRYWVGGAGTWNTTSTTNWSASSGGASGASVPTAADSVFFDQAGTYTVTMTGALTCLDITVSAGTVTFATGTTPTLAVSGSMSLIAGTIWSSTGAVTFNATTTGKTVTTNNISISAAVTFNGTGGGWTLGSNFTATGTLSVLAGALNTSAAGNYSLTLGGSFVLTGGTTTLNASSISIAGTLTVSNSTYISSGTSTITITNTSGITFAGGGATYYNVSFTATSLNSKTFTGTNTFNNLTFTAPTVAYIVTQNINANQTINGTLSVLGTTAVIRMLFVSNTLGTARTLTCAAVSIPDCDFRDITLAGAAAGSSPTRAGNCGGNTGITFPAAKTVYWNLAGAQNWSATGWATSSGGTPAINNFPLSQDTAVFDNTGSVTGTITINATWNIGTIDMSTRTSAMTIATSSASPNIYGDWKNGSGTTLSGGLTLFFYGRGNTQTILSAGKTFTQVLNIYNIGGTVQLADAFTTSATASAVNLNAGTFNLAGFTCTLTGTGNATGFVSTTTTYTRSINFGSGGSIIIAQSGTTAWNVAATNFSVSGTGTISLTNSIAKTFVGASVSYSGVTLNNGGAGALTISGSNTFANITNTVQPTTVTFTAATTTTVTNFGLTGTAGNLVTINSTGAAATLSKSSGTVSCDYLSITNSTATGGATWYAGANSTNGGGNSVWLFSAAPAATNSGAFFRLLMIN